MFRNKLKWLSSRKIKPKRLKTTTSDIGDDGEHSLSQSYDDPNDRNTPSSSGPINDFPKNQNPSDACAEINETTNDHNPSGSCVQLQIDNPPNDQNTSGSCAQIDDTTNNQNPTDSNRSEKCFSLVQPKTQEESYAKSVLGSTNIADLLASQPNDEDPGRRSRFRTSGCSQNFVPRTRNFMRRSLRRVFTWKCPQWEPNQDGILVQFIKTTRLDGLKFMVKKGAHLFVRFFYLVSFLLCSGFGGYLVRSTYLGFEQDAMVHKFTEKVSIGNLPYPAVTICPSHLFKYSKLEEAMKLYKDALSNKTAIDNDGNVWTLEEAAKLAYFVDQTCDSEKSYFRRRNETNDFLSLNLKDNNDFKEKFGKIKFHVSDPVYKYKIQPFLEQGMVNCESILAECEWGDNFKCSEIFQSIQTETGRCCTFNRIPPDILKTHKKKLKEINRHWLNWNIDDHKFFGVSSSHMNEIPRQQKYIGSKNGLSFILFHDSEDIACPVTDAPGYMIGITSPIDEPNTLINVITIPANQEVFINLKVDILKSNQNIKSLSVEKRKCYFQDENPLERYTHYTEANCYQERKYMIINDHCNCSLLFSTDADNETVCGPLQALCVANVTGHLKNYGLESMISKMIPVPKICYPACTEVTYGTVVSNSPLKSNFPVPDYINNSDGREMSIVHVFMTQESLMSIERQEQFNALEKAGIYGGLLGLTNGLDLMSILHILFAVFSFIASVFIICLVNRCKKFCEQMERVNEDDDPEEIGQFDLPSLVGSTDNEQVDFSVDPPNTTRLRRLSILV